MRCRRIMRWEWLAVAVFATCLAISTRAEAGPAEDLKGF